MQRSVIKILCTPVRTASFQSLLTIIIIIDEGSIKETVEDVALGRSCMYRRFGGTSVHTRSTRRYIPEDSILQSHHCENFKSYKETVVKKIIM
jgi:hypothetical protein